VSNELKSTLKLWVAVMRFGLAVISLSSLLAIFIGIQLYGEVYITEPNKLWLAVELVGIAFGLVLQLIPSEERVKSMIKDVPENIVQMQRWNNH